MKKIDVFLVILIDYSGKSRPGSVEKIVNSEPAKIFVLVVSGSKQFIGIIENMFMCISAWSSGLAQTGHGTDLSILIHSLIHLWMHTRISSIYNLNKG